MKQNQKSNARPKAPYSAYRMTVLAILAALTLALQWLSGMLTIGAVSITLSLVPVVIGAILLGPMAGTFLGAVLGAFNLVTSFSNPFLQLLFQSSPVLFVVLCFGKTMAAGAISGWIPRLFHKKDSMAGIIFSSLAAPVVNTGLFFAAMLTAFRAPLITFFGEAASANVFSFVALTIIGINFIVEFSLNAILCPAIHLIITAARKSRKKF